MNHRNVAAQIHERVFVDHRSSPRLFVLLQQMSPDFSLLPFRQVLHPTHGRQRRIFRHLLSKALIIERKYRIRYRGEHILKSIVLKILLARRSRSRPQSRTLCDHDTTRIRRTSLVKVHYLSKSSLQTRRSRNTQPIFAFCLRTSRSVFQDPILGSVIQIKIPLVRHLFGHAITPGVQVLIVQLRRKLKPLNLLQRIKEDLGKLQHLLLVVLHLLGRTMLRSGPSETQLPALVSPPVDPYTTGTRPDRRTS